MKLTFFYCILYTEVVAILIVQSANLGMDVLTLIVGIVLGYGSVGYDQCCVPGNISFAASRVNGHVLTCVGSTGVICAITFGGYGN